VHGVGLQPRARHRDVRLAESTRQRPRAAAVPVARDASRNLVVGSVRVLPPVARLRQHLVELAANHLFDEATNPFAQLLFDRIKPILEKMRGNFGG
jgi:hypothetical protein